MSFEKPILFLIFNRPETTQVVFEKIKEIKPKYLYIAADGPRDEKPDESKKCEAARNIIKQVDWDCEVKTLFREKNLGCKKAVSSAIDWFFNNVEEGIILEDDCLPIPEFFEFCSLMLDKYEKDQRISMISGTSYLFNKEISYNQYFLSRYFPIWGWATWKRSWNCYDLSMKNWPYFKTNKYLDWIYGNKKISQYFSSMFDLAYENKIDTWDIQWFYSSVFQNTLCVVPVYNLVSNIGYQGTRATDKPSIFMNMKTKQFDVKQIKFINNIIPNAKLDEIVFKNIGILKCEKKSKLYSLIESIKNEFN